MTGPYEGDWRPRLRAEIALEGGTGAAVTGLEDRLVGHRMSFGPLAGEVARRLDGTRQVGDVLREVQALAPESSASLLEGAVRSLLLLGAVEGAGDAVRASLQARRAGAPAAVHTLDGARFECQGSGACCRNYLYGPLTASDVRTLDALDLSCFPSLPPGAPYTVMQERGQTMVFLKSVEDRCVFLEEDARCGLHRRFGPEAKPFACRSYPIRNLLTYEGVRICDEGRCATLAVSAANGPLLQERAAELTPELVASLPLWHPGVMLPGRVPCDYGFLAPVEAALVLRLGREELDAGEALLLVAGALRQLGERLAGCPLAPGEPDATVAGLVDEVAGGASFDLDATQEDAVAAANALTYAFLGAVLPSALNVEANPLVNLARSALQAMAEPLLLLLVTLDAQRGEQVDAEVVRVLRLPVPPEARAVLRLALRQQLFGGRLLVDGRVGAGVIRLAAVHMTSLVGAKLRAARQGKAQVDPLDVSWAHHVAQRALRGPRFDPLFGDEECRAWDFAAAAAALG